MTVLYDGEETRLESSGLHFLPGMVRENTILGAIEGSSQRSSNLIF